MYLQNTLTHAKVMSTDFVIIFRRWHDNRDCFFARSASYVRTLVQNSSVSVSVRPCVRKIITFCREYMNPRHVLLDSGVLETWFWRFQKKTTKSQVKLYHGPVRDQFWDQVLANFWCNVNMGLWRQFHVVASDASSFLLCREMSSYKIVRTFHTKK